MPRTITLPDFDFSGFYYPQLLEALIAFKRANVPELTDESDEEPTIQLMRAFALVGHLSNTLVDLVANNSTLPTSELPEVVRNMLRLIDYEMAAASPSQVDVIYELATVITAEIEVVPERAQAATKKEGDVEPVHFEALEALSVEPTDEFSWVLSGNTATPTLFDDHTTEANDQTPGVTWQPAVTPAARDAIYFGHKHAMWDKLSFVFDTALPYGLIFILEFYDGNWRKTAPTDVVYGGGQLEFDLTGLLGGEDRRGTIVRVQYNPSTNYEEVVSTWDGFKNIVTTGLLGQTSPSEVEADYTVGSDWTEITLVEDTTEGWTQDGEYSFQLPQTLTKNWIQTEIDGKNAYWLRIRTITSGGGGPTFEYVRMDEGKQYVHRQLTQGRTTTDSPSSSTGLPDQEFELAREHFIWNSEEIAVEDEVWTSVENFLDSLPTAKHYAMKLGDNDRGIVTFGSGDKGKVPPTGAANITKSYRYGANQDGNVGAGTVVVDKTGLSYVNSIWNPRQAVGWAQAQGATEASLEEAKIEGPNSLRIKTVALGPDDVVDLAVAWTDENGVKPFARAQAFEEGFGPKTIELVLVTRGGGIATQQQLEAIELYFNGNKYASPPLTKHLVSNQEVGAVNFSPKVIDVVATVYGEVTAEQVINQLEQNIQPEAKKDDGLTWKWKFGGEVATSQINSIAFKTDPSITKVLISEPAAETTLLQPRELPVLGNVSITVVTP